MAFKSPERKRVYHQGYFREKYKDPVFRKAHIQKVMERNKRVRKDLFALLDEFKAQGCRLCPGEGTVLSLSPSPSAMEEIIQPLRRGARSPRRHGDLQERALEVRMPLS